MRETPLASDFWRARRVLVTGHTGFKGGWLCHWLHEMGAEVHGLALPPETAPSFFDKTNLGAKLASHNVCDICDREAARDLIRFINPEITFHMAAQALVRRAYADPVQSIAANVLGTAHVLDALRQLPILASSSGRVIINVTSDKCYENTGDGKPFVESDPMGGSDPYSASKGCAELISNAFAQSYFATGRTVLANARAGNVIGGGDWADDRLVPDIVRALATNRAVEIRNPEATRPWQHVLEPLSGYIRLSERLWAQSLSGNASLAGGWNFGPRPENAVSVKRLLAEIQGVVDQVGWEMQPGNHPKEAARLHLDIGKAEKYLDWHPVLSLSETVKMTMDWYKTAATQQDMSAFTTQQIKDYVMYRAQTSDMRRP